MLIVHFKEMKLYPNRKPMNLLFYIKYSTSFIRYATTFSS